MTCAIVVVYKKYFHLWIISFPVINNIICNCFFLLQIP